MSRRSGVRLKVLPTWDMPFNSPMTAVGLVWGASKGNIIPFLQNFNLFPHITSCYEFKWPLSILSLKYFDLLYVQGRSRVQQGRGHKFSCFERRGEHVLGLKDRHGNFWVEWNKLLPSAWPIKPSSIWISKNKQQCMADRLSRTGHQAQ